MTEMSKPQTFIVFDPKCQEGEFKCRSGDCTTACDGLEECSDKQDEAGCLKPGESAECKRDQYLCAERCIPDLWYCDGQPDCSDRSDEISESCQSRNASMSKIQEQSG